MTCNIYIKSINSIIHWNKVHHLLSYPLQHQVKFDDTSISFNEKYFFNCDKFMEAITEAESKGVSTVIKFADFLDPLNQQVNDKQPTTGHRKS